MHSVSKPLRILEIVDTLDAGGMEAQLVALINRLDTAQFEFQVVCLRHTGVCAQKLRKEVIVHALQKQPGFKLKTAAQISRIARQGGFDLIHTHNWAPLIYAALGSFGGKTHPILHGEHAQLNKFETRPLRLWLRRMLYKCCSSIHTVSSGQKEELLRLGFSQSSLCSLVNGVDTTRFHPLSNQTERSDLRERLIPGSAHDFWIGSVARFGSYKRHRELITAFEHSTGDNEHSRLIFVGDGGPEKDNVSKQIKASPLRERIHCVGYQTDPVKYYQSFDLLVVPSSNEGLSNATMEAMACGVPVLSNAICGAHELIGEEEAGWITDLSSVESLRDALQSLIRRPLSDVQEHGKFGRLRVLKYFSWESMAQRYADTFHACAKGQFPLGARQRQAVTPPKMR
jgi:glycosyltransferase involved in cell wall biosynthesis